MNLKLEVGELEWECASCGGTGEAREFVGGECANCDGTGYQKSELGEKILDLMFHNLKKMLELIKEED